MPDYRNPFIVGSPVPPERFIGREKEVETILDRLVNPAHGSTAVSGEAQIGKTSLLHYISTLEIAEKWELLPEKCTFIFMDSQTIAPFSPMGFWRYVLKSLAACKVYEPNYIEGLLQGDDVGSFELGELFDRIARGGKLAVLLLDEFEHVAEHVNPDDPQFLSLLRTLVNRPAHGLALVLASRKPLPVLCQNMRFAGSPFPTGFISLSLGSFSPQEANKLIDVYTQDTGIIFSDRDREFACEISKGHCYQLQKVCFKLFKRHKEKVRVRDEQFGSLDDFDYKAIAAEMELEDQRSALLEIAEKVIEETDHEEIAAGRSSNGLWYLLARHPMTWFAIGIVVVVIITFLFFEPLRCVLEFRLTEATVALITLLAVGIAGMTFSIAPPQTDKVLKCLYGGFAVALMIVIIAMKCLPQPPQESCFPAQVPTPTAAPTSTHTMTPTSTELLTNTPSPTPTPAGGESWTQTP